MNTKTAKHLIYTSTGSYRYFCSEDISQDVVGECSNLASSLLKNIQPPAYSWWQREIHGGLIAIGYSEKSSESGRPTEHYHCILIDIEDFCNSDLKPRQIAPLLMSHRKTLDNIITDDTSRDNDEVIKSSDEERKLLVTKIELSPEDSGIPNIGQRELDWLISRGVLGKENGQLDIQSKEEAFDLIAVLPVHLRAGFSFCCGSILPEGRLPFNITFKISEEADKLIIPEAPEEYRLSQEIGAIISNTDELSKLQSSFERYWEIYKFICPELSLAEMNEQVVEIYPDEQKILERTTVVISDALKKNDFARAIEIVDKWEKNSINNQEIINQWKQSIWSEVSTYASNLTSSSSDADFKKISDFFARVSESGIFSGEIAPDLEKIKLSLFVLQTISRKDPKKLQDIMAHNDSDIVLGLIEDMLRKKRAKESNVQKTLRGTKWEDDCIEHPDLYPNLYNMLKKTATTESLNEYSKSDIADALRKQTVAEFVSQYGESQDFWQITRSGKIGELLRAIESNPQNEIEHLAQGDSSSLLVKVPELILLGAEKDGRERFTSNAAAFIQTLLRITAPKPSKHSLEFKWGLFPKKNHDPDKNSAIDETYDLIAKHLGDQLNKLKEMFGHQPQFDTEWEKYMNGKKH